MRIFFRIIFVVVIFAVLVYGFDYAYFYFQERPARETALQPMPPSQAQTRLLVFAPHCDDETLGCAELIHSTIAAGGQVLVAIITNGDGFTFAVEEQFKRLYLTSDDYITSGYERQKESLRALAQLGLPESQVLFLGYPDRGMNRMWKDYWDEANPYFSRYTGRDHSPYTDSYHYNAPHAGQVVLADLEKIITDYQPTVILLPHPNDEHPDHAATWAFVSTAVAKLEITGQLPPVSMYTYLVHRGDFPIPHGYLPQTSLLPPRPLFSIYPSQWRSFPIDPEARKIKYRAVYEYDSQIKVPIMSALLKSFIRTNELFAETPIPTIKTVPLALDLTHGELWQDSGPVLVNPKGVRLLGAIESKAQLSEVYSCAQNNDIWLKLKIPQFMEKKNSYSVTFISFMLQGNQLQREKRVISFAAHDANLQPTEIFLNKDEVILKITLNQMPVFYFFQVTTKDRIGALLDMSVWQPVFIQR